MKYYKQIIGCMLSAGLLFGSAPFAAAEEAADSFQEEVDIMEEEPEEEAVEESAGDAAQSQGASQDSAPLIVDSHPTSGGGLPNGLSLAESIRSRFETQAMVTVDPSKYPAANFSENAREVYWYCRTQLGLNHAAACGVLGNVQLESSFRPLAIGDGGTSYGICQWHLGRCSALMSYCSSNGLDYNTLEGQLAYLRYELTGGYSGVYSALLGVPDTPEGAFRAAWVMCVSFEIPDQADARGQQRGNLAMNNYYPINFARTASFTIAKDAVVRKTASKTGQIAAPVQAGTEVTLGSKGIQSGLAQIVFESKGETVTGYIEASLLKHVKEPDPLSEEEETRTAGDEAETEPESETEAGGASDPDAEQDADHTETAAETVDQAEASDADVQPNE